MPKNLKFLILSVAAASLVCRTSSGEADRVDANTFPATTCPAQEIQASHVWSPDSEKIAFVSPTKGVQVYSIKSKQIESVGSKPFFGTPVWSGHDNRVAILHTDAVEENQVADGTVFIWWDRYGDPPVPVASGVSANFEPVWSPDDKWLLVMHVTGALMTVDPWTGIKRRVFVPDAGKHEAVNGQAVWIDNTHTAVQIGVGRLVSIDVESGVQATLATGKSFPDLRSNGKGTVWAVEYFDKRFRVIEIDDGRTDVLMPAQFSGFDGPNARNEIVASFLSDHVIRIIDLKKGTVTPLPDSTSDSEPIWSPDGIHIAFSRKAKGENSYLLCIASRLRPDTR